MMSGVAQVMGMKPILRSFFSIGPLSCAMACRLATGSTLAIAAEAVRRPTALRKRRRRASCGNSALTRAASTKRLASDSKSAAWLRSRRVAVACSASLRCWPQAQPRRKGRSAS